MVGKMIRRARDMRSEKELRDGEQQSQRAEL
jgi:hypothetical protein